jgi:inosose dehydratase
MTIKLGIAPINWCNDDDPKLGKDISFEQCISEMSLAGFVGTELGNKYPTDPEVLKSALDEQGLSLSSSWFSTYFTEADRYEETLERFLDKLSFMRAMGADFINVCECGHAIQGTEAAIFGPAKPQFNALQWQLLIQGLHTLGRIAYDFNCRIVYHYHAGTGVFTEGEIYYLMQHTSPQLLSLLLDTGHAAFAGIDPLHLIHKYGDRIKYVHLKDIRMPILQQVKDSGLSFMDGVRSGVFTVPGDGCLDFSSIVMALKKGGYEGWMIVEAEQDPALAPPLEYATKAFAHLGLLI